MKLLLLNREEELVSIISETTSDPIYDEVLNGKDTFEFEVSEYSVEKGYRVLFQDINSDWREYIVTGIEEKHNRNGLRKKIYCESSYYELLGDWLADIRPNNRTARYALEQALSTSRWEVGIVDDLGLNSTNYYRTDAKTAVEKVAEVWGGEIKTRIEVIGNKVTGRFVDLYRNRGTDSGKRFTYTKDIEEVTREVSEDLIITALHGFGKSEEIGDGFGRRIDFSSINNGKSYLENNSARLMYGRNNSDGTKSHVFGKVEFDDIEDIELLKTETQKALDALSIPSVLYKVQVQDLSVFGYEHEKVNLGDYVLTADKEFIPELRFKARVVGIKRNLANELETEITIGNVLESYTSKMNSQSNALNDIRDRIGVLDKIADGSYQLPRADGQGYNYYGSVAPSNPHNGDIWFKPNGEYQEMWQYVDGQWTLLIDTSVSEQLKQEVDAAIAQAEEAKKEAENAYTDAVTEAERLVEEQSEAFDAQMAGVNQEINTVKINIDTAITNVNQEIANNFTSLSDSISDVNSIANQAKADAQKGITDAATALSQAQSAIIQLGGLSGKITSVEHDIDDINGVLSTKVSTTEFNSLTGAVDNLSTTQTQQAGLIAQKANQSTVDTLTGRVSTAEGQITTQAGQIALRVTEVQAKSIADSVVGSLEIGSVNLIPHSNDFATGYSNYASASVTRITGVSVPEWGTDDATRIETSGGTNRIKTHRVLFNPDDLIDGQQYTFSLYIKNVGTNPINVNLNLPHNEVVYPNDSKRLVLVVRKDAAAQFQVQFRTFGGNIGDPLDFIVYGLQVEIGNKATAYRPALEDTVSLISAVSSELSIEKDNITALLTRTGNNETTINQVKSTADGTVQTVADHAGRLTMVETSVSGLQTTVADKADKSQITQLSTDINLRVTKGELLSQINVQADNILIQTNKLYLDVNSVHMTTAYINDIKAKSLEAVYADITKLRTQLLIANVIDATMIKTEAATINKLFATDGMITTLTSKTAFINNIKAIDISADRITTGTLNAANVNIINLNVSSIVGLNSNFVHSLWNSNNASVSISADGLVSVGGDGDKTKIRNGLAQFWNNSDNLTGSIGTSYRTLDAEKTGVAVFLEYGKTFSVNRKASYDSTSYGQLMSFPADYAQLDLRRNLSMHNNDIVNAGKITVQNGIEMTRTSLSNLWQATFVNATTTVGRVGPMSNSNDLGVHSAGALYLGVNGSGTYSSPLVARREEVQLNNTLNMNKQVIQDAWSIKLRNSSAEYGSIVNVSGTNDLAAIGAGSIYLGVGSSAGFTTTLRIHKELINAYWNINMNGKSVTGTSDLRLKTNITNTNVIALNLFRQFNFVDYDWIDKKTNPDRQFGLIAQHTPFLSIYDTENDLWMLDSSKQTMLNSLGIQELDKNVINLSDRVNLMDHRFADEINEVRTISNNALTKTEELEKRIEELENEIELLKSA